MIFWTGFGILAPVILAIGVAIAQFADKRFGWSDGGNPNWVPAFGFALGGLFCFLAGRRFYGRGTRTMIDKASGREVTVGESHTFMFIPLHWIGILALLGSIPIGIYGIPETTKQRKKREMAEATGAPPEASQKTPPPPVKYASVAAAQQAAIARHPTLGLAGSDFNKRFLQLHKERLASDPAFFSDNSWPLKLADEVAGEK